MEFVPVLVMLALVKKLVDFVRAANAHDYNGIVTQIVAWIGGILVATLVANSSWADGVIFGDIALGKMGFVSQVFAGLALGSAASLASDFTPRNVSPPMSDR